MTECKKCNGTGAYAYDHNHSQVCDACCPHDQGWFELSKGYANYIEGQDNRCCRVGCGTMKREANPMQHIVSLLDSY